jgi:phosphatidylserine decarboxylase
LDREKRLRESKIAREGFAFIGLSLVVSILFYLFGFPLLSALSFLFCLFCLFFFRNPKRVPTVPEDVLVSPADGKVMEIKEMVEAEFMGGATRRVSIFMSLASVHVNRAPCEGRIVRVEHRAGEFALAFRKDIDKENERNYILLKRGEEKILLVQIAGFLARRITSYVKEGDPVEKGDPVGIIAFGSRVDIYLPKGYDLMVSLGNKVNAGITPLARKQIA